MRPDGNQAFIDSRHLPWASHLDAEQMGKGTKFQVKMNTGKRWGWERLRESWDRVVE